MIKLHRKLPVAVVIALGPGATARVRPATSMDIDRATDFVAQFTKGAMALGADGLDLLAIALGEEEPLELTAEKIASCATRLSLARLSEICTESWSGIGDEAGAPLPLTLANLLLLQRDPMLRQKFSEAINAGVHEEVREKNGSGASLNGGAPADEPAAPSADKTASPAPLASQEPTATIVPNTSTLR